MTVVTGKFARVPGKTYYAVLAWDGSTVANAVSSGHHRNKDIAEKRAAALRGLGLTAIVVRATDANWTPHEMAMLVRS